MKTRSGRGALALARGAGGFTLVELLVVLAILALLASIAVPRLSARSPGVDVAASAARIAAGLRYARAKAIRSSRDALFTLDAADRSWWLEGGGSRQRLDGPVSLLLTTAAPERVSAHVGGIRFFPDGTSTGGTVEVAAGNVRSRVTVDWLTGAIRVERP